ncbi:MAG: AI-2E family transporter [bacterium]|nr:AI-2E family transporter [bacterium]
MKLNKNKNFTVWLSAFIFIALVIIFDKVVAWFPDIFAYGLSFLSVLSPFIGGFIIAFILYIPAGNLEKLLKKIKLKFVKRHARGFSILFTYLIFFSIIAVALYFLIPKIVRNVSELVGQMPTYYDRVINFIQNNTDSKGRVFGIKTEQLSTLFNYKNLLSFFSTSTIFKSIKGVFRFGSAIVTTAFSFIISVYMLAAREHLIQVCGKVLALVFPKNKLRACYNYITRISEIFYNYIYSQLLDCLVVSLILSIVFSIIKVPYAVLFAILIGICNLIPYFGATLSGLAVTLFVFMSNNIIAALITAVCIVVVQQLDANLLQPRIVGNTVGIRPIYVLLAITVGGGLFGFVGILIGVPLIATIRMILLDIIKHRNAEERSLQE